MITWRVKNPGNMDNVIYGQALMMGDVGVKVKKHPVYR